MEKQVEKNKTPILNVKRKILKKKRDKNKTGIIRIGTRKRFEIKFISDRSRGYSHCGRKVLCLESIFHILK